MTYTFFVPGIPKTKGSTKSFYNPKAKKIVTMGANKGEKSWEGKVAYFAGQAGVALSEMPIQLTIHCFFQRPKCHFNKKGIKQDAPDFPLSRNIGDVDKLARAVLDGLTGVAYYDDSQVISVICSKRWMDHCSSGPGADICIE